MFINSLIYLLILDLLFSVAVRLTQFFQNFRNALFAQMDLLCIPVQLAQNYNKIGTINLFPQHCTCLIVSKKTYHLVKALDLTSSHGLARGHTLIPNKVKSQLLELQTVDSAGIILAYTVKLYDFEKLEVPPR